VKTGVSNAIVRLFTYLFKYSVACAPSLSVDLWTFRSQNVSHQVENVNGQSPNPNPILSQPYPNLTIKLNLALILALYETSWGRKFLIPSVGSAQTFKDI